MRFKVQGSRFKGIDEVQGSRFKGIDEVQGLVVLGAFQFSCFQIADNPVYFPAELNGCFDEEVVLLFVDKMTIQCTVNL